METTIKRTVLAEHMEQLFERSDSQQQMMIKHFVTSEIVADEDWDIQKKYKYEIRIRHSEDTKAGELFDAAIRNLTPPAKRKQLCKSHVTLLNKITSSLAYSQKIDGTQLILGLENRNRIKSAESLLFKAITLLENVK